MWLITTEGKALNTAHVDLIGIAATSAGAQGYYIYATRAGKHGQTTIMDDLSDYDTAQTIVRYLFLLEAQGVKTVDLSTNDFAEKILDQSIEARPTSPLYP